MKKYISPGSWFSFEYPEAWSEFEDDEGSFLFYNPESWSGNFRISASLDVSPDFANEVRKEEIKLYPDTRLVQVGQLEYTYNQETFQEDDVWYTSHFLVTGVKNMAVYCTFTLHKGASTDEAVGVLNSLKLMNPKKPQCSEIISIRLMEIAKINEAYAWALKVVKDACKKDFSSSVTESITCLQQLLDGGKLKMQRDSWGKLGLLLGCFLVDEADNVEWVTVINGADEYPALILKDRENIYKRTSLSEVRNSVISPAEFVKSKVSQMKECKLDALYEMMVNNFIIE